MYILLFLFLEASTLRKRKAWHWKPQSKIQLDSKKGLMQQKTEKLKLVFDSFSAEFKEQIV